MLPIMTVFSIIISALLFCRWAILKDEDVYRRMVLYISQAEMGISRDAQLRALKLLKVIVRDDGKEIFDFGYKRMTDRWKKLNHIISMSKRFSLQEISPQYCNFLNRIREPSPGDIQLYLYTFLYSSYISNFH